MRIIILLFFILPLFFFNVALANQDDIGQSRIHPASPFYFLKSVREIFEIKFSGTSQIRGLRYLEFSTRRIREVKTLITVNRPDLIPSTLEKYWFNMEKALGLIDLKNINLTNKIIDYVGQHIFSFEQAFSQTDNQKAKIAIRLAIYRISQWNEQLLERLTPEDRIRLSTKITENQLLVCKFLSKEASSSALNDTERVVLTERVQKCLQIKSL